jgi:hypothetical protein
VLDLPSSQAFGRIQDVVVVGANDDRVVVLDGMAKELRVFTPEGELMDVLGGPGFGPGEYFQPVAAEEAGGILFVFDADGRATKYSTTGDRVSFIEQLRLEVEIYDGCILGDGIVVNGRRPSGRHVLHLFDQQGKHIRSFGDLYSVDNRIISLQLSRGQVACGASGILFASSILPELRYFSLDGREKWWIRVEGAVPVQFEEVNGGSLMHIPKDGYHSNLDPVVGPADRAAWQIAEIRGRGAGSTMTNFTWVVDLSAGSAEYVGGGLPEILDWRDGQVVTLSLDRDFPVLSQWTLR